MSCVAQKESKTPDAELQVRFGHSTFFNHHQRFLIEIERVQQQTLPEEMAFGQSRFGGLELEVQTAQDLFRKSIAHLIDEQAYSEPKLGLCDASRNEEMGLGTCASSSRANRTISINPQK